MGIWNWLKRSVGIPISQIDGQTGVNLGLTVPPASSGVTVSETTALSLSVLYRAARVIAESVGGMPLKVYGKTSEGRIELPEDPNYKLLHDEWNSELSATDGWTGIIWDAVVTGNGYAEIIRDGANPVELQPLLPFTVKRIRGESGWGYEVVEEGGERFVFSVDMIHIAGPRPNAYSQGYRLVSLARESLGLALATEDFCSRSFANNMKMGGTLEHPGKLTDPGRENLRKSWHQAQGGTKNTGKWALLEEGIKANPFQINFEQGQVVEFRKQLVFDICRWIGVDPIFVYEYGDATWNNAEAQTRNFLQFSLNPYLVKTESETNRKIVRSPDRYAEFVRESVVQMDSKTQAEVWQIGVQMGWYTQDEVRKWLNLPKLKQQPVIQKDTQNGNVGTTG